MVSLHPIYSGKVLISILLIGAVALPIWYLMTPLETVSNRAAIINYTFLASLSTSAAAILIYRLRKSILAIVLTSVFLAFNLICCGLAAVFFMEWKTEEVIHIDSEDRNHRYLYQTMNCGATCSDIRSVELQEFFGLVWVIKQEHHMDGVGELNVKGVSWEDLRKDTDSSLK